jgi:hypothetical protein
MPGAKRRPRRLHGRELDEQLSALLNHWTYWKSEAELQAMGPPALERLLDSLEGKVDLWTGRTEMDGREYDGARQAGVAAFAKVNMAAVLRAFKARGWSSLQVALSGIGRVPDRRMTTPRGMFHPTLRHSTRSAARWHRAIPHLDSAAG